ncbi:MAG TPA: leucine-rich repeat domain-containing protein [Bacilli bacterium]|nr:leucine-rich repeat domain-containing protein [Bacilli bacterium]
MNKKGFTLIELIAVIVILSIILLIAIPKITEVVNTSKKESLVSSTKILAKAIQSDFLSSGKTRYMLDDEGILYRCSDDLCSEENREIVKYSGKLKSKEGAVILVALGNGEVILQAGGTICDKSEKYCIQTDNNKALKSLVINDVRSDGQITSAPSTSAGTTSVTTTSSGTELLVTGSIKKADTSGDVIYNFYSNGHLDLIGTGDGIMKDFESSNGLSFICSSQSLLSAINNELEQGVVLDEDTNMMFIYAYIFYEVHDFDSFYDFLIAMEVEITEEDFQAMAVSFFGEDYIQVMEDLGETPTISSVTITGVTEIGQAAFQYTNISEINIPNSVTKIGIGAFGGNNSNSVTLTLGNSVNDIDSWAFSNITNLATVHLPDSVDYVRSYAFAYNSISNVTFNNGLLHIGDFAFYDNHITSVTLPDSVTELGQASFCQNQITSLTIGDGLTTIGGNAFQSNQLTSVTIPNNITEIGTGAFYQNQLTSVTIGSGVTTIREAAFAYNQLSNITIPSNVVTIENFAFLYNNFSSVTIQGETPTRFNDNWSNIGFNPAPMPE